jgi:hypothetical protein
MAAGPAPAFGSQSALVANDVLNDLMQEDWDSIDKAVNESATGWRRQPFPRKKSPKTFGVAALQIFARDELDRGSNSIKRRSYGPQGMTEPGRDRWLRCLITHHPDPFPSPYPTRLSLPTLSVLISVNHIFPSGPRMMRCIIVFSLGTG